MFWRKWTGIFIQSQTKAVLGRWSSWADLIGKGTLPLFTAGVPGCWAVTKARKSSTFCHKLRPGRDGAAYSQCACSSHLLHLFTVSKGNVSELLFSKYRLDANISFLPVGSSLHRNGFSKHWRHVAESQVFYWNKDGVIFVSNPTYKLIDKRSTLCALVVWVYQRGQNFF